MPPSYGKAARPSQHRHQLAGDRDRDVPYMQNALLGTVPPPAVAKYL
jgi:hypothetical protein